MNEFQRFLAIQAAVCAVINMALNAGIGIYFFRGMDIVPLWGTPGIALDTLVMAFLLPWLTVLFIAPFAWMEMKKGTAEKFKEELRTVRHSYLKYMPDGFFLQSLILGFGTAVIFSPIIAGLLSGLGITGMRYQSAVILKTVLAMILALAVSPVTWLSALKKYVGGSND
jgi:hypothetical protein